MSMISTTHERQQKDLISILQGIGMTKNQAIVYMAILELGPSPIWDIAQLSGLKRSTCYSLLEELIIKGHANSTNDGKRAIYDVTSPKRLLLAAETRVNRFARTLNEFDFLANKTLHKPSIRFYEGEAGVKEVYFSCLDMPKGQEVYVISDPAQTHATYPEVMKDYIAERIRRKIPSNGIFVDTPENRVITPTDLKSFRQSRYLTAAKLNLSVETQISGDRLAYISHSVHNPFAMVIESPLLAEQERQRFQLIWELAQD